MSEYNEVGFSLQYSVHSKTETSGAYLKNTESAFSYSNPKMLPSISRSIRKKLLLFQLRFTEVSEFSVTHEYMYVYAVRQLCAYFVGIRQLCAYFMGIRQLCAYFMGIRQLCAYFMGIRQLCAYFMGIRQLCAYFRGINM